ncbi:SMP-30/gluconolactonase/LRE family protein [Liquorilactobacillus mali]|uniref:Regucalcin n=1 Tax=Liquorilactobacillus mali TaxID=1618 RepID=A0A0R2FNF1_9LACO|nr:SMP-30/gluconolactonase/LRE family protein [Liquorilactobacillus mali]KRN30016.1 hypothetical protein IV36_GL000285 [Liquorilactobacillus mali]
MPFIDIGANGLGWSPDNKFMYYIDSGKKLIYQFNYNLQEGKLSEKKVIINFESEDANPDGMTVDADGMLWICHWGGYKISRWDPYKKEKIGEIILPVKQITCPTFVGEDFSKMVITTARYGCSREELNSNPDAGSIFILDIAGVSGIEPNLANM